MSNDNEELKHRSVGEVVRGQEKILNLKQAISYEKTLIEDLAQKLKLKQELEQRLEKTKTTDFIPVFALTPELAPELKEHHIRMQRMIDNAINEDTEMRDLINKAEKGDVDAQNNLAHRYHFGIKVEQDDKEAFKWLLKAAEQGCGSAQENTANMYLTGKGVEQDDKQATYWFEEAAKLSSQEKELVVEHIENERKKAKERHDIAAENRRRMGIR